MKRLSSVFLLLFCMLFTVNTSTAFAATTENPLFRAEVITATEKLGDTLSVTLSPNREVAAFIANIEYDTDVITDVRAELTGTSKKDFLTFTNEDGSAALAYTAAKDAMPKTGGILLHFHTNSEASVTASEIKLQIADAADLSAQPMLTQAESHTVTVEFAPPPSTESTLLSLTPPAGTLTPEFDPAVFEYTLEVPFAYTTLTFDAVPAEGASVKVNRKNLGSGGSTVDFDFTVTAADGSTKTTYTVAVTRLEKDAAPADTNDTAKENTNKTTQNKTETKTKTTASVKTEKEKSETITTTTTDEGTAVVTTGAAPTDTTEPVTYIYQETKTNLWVDRLITAAIVLVSVGAGAGITLLLQSHGKNKDKTK